MVCKATGELIRLLFSVNRVRLPAESGFAGHSTDSRLCLPALKSIVTVQIIRRQGMNGIDKEEFGTFVAKLRKEQGMTQKDLAAKVYLLSDFRPAALSPPLRFPRTEPKIRLRPP